jgi:hypothetical protein
MINMILFLLLSGAVITILVQQYKLRRAWRVSAAHVARRLLAEVRGEDKIPRYEIQVTDRGGLEPDVVRYRWSVWDADHALRDAAFPTAGEIEPTAAGEPVVVGELDPDGKLGIEVPYMLGDASTYEAAILAADAWVSAQGAESVVISPMLIEEPPRAGYANGATSDAAPISWAQPSTPGVPPEDQR